MAFKYMLALLNRVWKRWRNAQVSEESSEEMSIHASFDAQWYLAAYPDVATADIDPWQHYWRHGQYEGRLPHRNLAVGWEHALWRGAHGVIVPRLERLIVASDSNTREQLSARWLLAQWYAWQSEWFEVLQLLAPKRRLLMFDHPGPALLMIDIACRQVRTKHAKKLARSALNFLKHYFPHHPDTPLAMVNVVSLEKRNDGRRLKVISQHFEAYGLHPVALANSERPLALDNLVAGNSVPTTSSPSPRSISESPLITVIIPLYNAEHTVGTALRGLIDQQGVRLEIIVVDDASEDKSVEVVKDWQKKVPDHVTLRLIRHTLNQGAYAARNTALVAAKGEFITTHDSDDWSHPQKLALQSQVLIKHPDVKASLSYWVRVTPGLIFHRWRLDDYGWVYPNLSSLMFRRSVYDELGYWDNVNVNADTEYRLRIEAAYGKQSLEEVLPGVPLSFGRADEGSLSQHMSSHLASQFTGMRFGYTQAARHWHGNTSNLYMPPSPTQRLFSAPNAMLRATSPANPVAVGFEALLNTSLFDAGWYLERYIDLQSMQIEPLVHFWEAGGYEGRDPGPNFSTSGYLRSVSTSRPLNQHPLAHYLSLDTALPELALPVWQGNLSFSEGPTVLLCGHQSGSTLFGAERSLLDILDAMKTLGWNVVVTLPEAHNQAYEQAILQRSKALAILPYGWWQVGRSANEDTVAHFQALIQRFDVSAVHGNTVVLYEPYIAAHREGVSSLIHVRELPSHDTALCELMGATPLEVVAYVHEHADIIIANSDHTARAFRNVSNGVAHTPNIHVVPNTFDMAPLLALPERTFTKEARVRVGMLSSNVAKKGLEDIEIMARHLQTLAPLVDVILYGPYTPLIASLQSRQAQDMAPANIQYAGYSDTPAQALSQLDMVVNLSRFQESFGRTVLEAMAAGKPVVAYEWGAIPELILDNETGHLIPFAHPEVAAEKIADLSNLPERCLQMGKAGRVRATEWFGADRFKDALARGYKASTLKQLPF